MHPTPSPLDTLRQLKEMLDAGAITPEEFQALKEKMVFGQATPPVPVAPTAAFAEPAAIPASPAPPAAPELPAVTPEPEAFGPAPDLAPPGNEQFELLEGAADDYQPEAPAPRSYLNLVLSIGGLLALLGTVLYLNWKTGDSEHIGSTSLTPNDTISTIETGPQVPQNALPPTAPETVRVAPAHPAQPLPPTSATPPPADSAAPAMAAPDSL